MSTSSSSSVNSFSYQDNHNWKLCVTVLELLQNVMQVQNIYELIPQLFDILKRLVDVESNPNVDYVKQLVLSALLRCCTNLPPQKVATVERQIKIDLIIRCIRTTTNAQTHHHALLLLAIAAAASPDQVLHNLVDIFTFMGTSVVARYDDAYSFQIMSKIIENVIPKMVEKSGEVINLLKVFSDIIIDVPSHRRQMVYSKLIETLGASEYFWIFLGVLLEGYVMRYEANPKKGSQKNKRRGEEDSEYPEQIEIALNIAKNFSPQINLKTCFMLINFINYLPMERGLKLEEKNPQFDAIFDVGFHSDKQLRFFRYITLQLVRAILASTDNTDSVVINIDDNTRAELRPVCTSLVGDILRFIPHVTKAANGQVHQAYWKVVLNYCYDILDNTVSLLKPDLFLQTIQELIHKHELYSVRIKALEILIRKLMNNFFEDTDESALLSLLEPLNEIVESVGNETVSDTFNPQCNPIITLIIFFKTFTDTRQYNKH